MKTKEQFTASIAAHLERFAKKGADPKAFVTQRELDMRSAFLLEEIASLKELLEARTYQGVWDEKKAYAKENSVSFGGSVWIARADTTKKPGEHESWQLAVKRGRDGR